MHHTPCYPLWMVAPNERLQIAREKARYASAKEAAEAMGAKVATYIQHENGTRGISPKRAERYARFFRVKAEWILFGKGDGPTIPLEPSEDELASMLESAMQEIPASATIGDWPRLAASALHEQLKRFRADRADQANLDIANAPGTGARSPAPTRPSARE